MRIASVAGVALALGALACAPDHGDAFKKSFAAAERAKAAGRYQEAADQYAAASRSAKIRRDADYAAYDSAMTLAQAGDVRGAVLRLEELAKKQPKSEYTAKAAVDAALLRIRHGEPDRGWADLEAAIKAHPQEEAALSSLQKLVRRKDEASGEAGTVAWLEGLRGSFESTRLGETILYERARRLRNLGKKEEASAAYVECATKYPYPYGAHFDDALFHASELEEELGRPKEAVALLLRMLHEREVAHMMGSYQRPLYDDALFRAAKLSEEKLGDRARPRALPPALHRPHDLDPARRRDLARGGAVAGGRRRVEGVLAARGHGRQAARHPVRAVRHPALPVDRPPQEEPRAGRVPRLPHAAQGRGVGRQRASPPARRKSSTRVRSPSSDRSAASRARLRSMSSRTGAKLRPLARGWCASTIRAASAAGGDAPSR